MGRTRRSIHCFDKICLDIDGWSSQAHSKFYLNLYYTWRVLLAVNHMLLVYLTVEELWGEIHNCPIQLDGREWLSNLIVVDLPKDDIILGIDWIDRHDAIINDRRRLVTIVSDDGVERSFQGGNHNRSGKVISAMNAVKLLNQGCVGYWCYMTKTEKSSVALTDIPVVRDYADVFPDELPGLPPHIDVEFTIELEPGTSPLSKAPYRMAPTERKELKDKLEELLEKGYIRPSASPWEHQFYLSKRKMVLYGYAWIIGS
ncbi:hypothetical protein OROMI_009243 [Orobanche minor]